MKYFASNAMQIIVFFLLWGGVVIWLVHPKSNLFYYPSPVSKVNKLPKLAHKSVQHSTKAKLDHFLSNSAPGLNLSLSASFITCLGLMNICRVKWTEYMIGVHCNYSTSAQAMCKVSMMESL